MSLDPLHEHIPRIAFALPEAEPVALAGGGAMLAHHLVDRPTQDLDLIAPDPSEVTWLADALAAAAARSDAAFAELVVAPVSSSGVQAAIRSRS